MTDIHSTPAPPTSRPRSERSTAKRRDDQGRAFAGSQRCLQIWVNEKGDELAQEILRALRLDGTGTTLEWISPLRSQKYAEFRDGAFLERLDLLSHAEALREFWPKGGPVWDGLARIVRGDGTAGGVVLVEGKSYPEEVRGGGCKATYGSKSRELIETALLSTARWLGLATRPSSWMNAYYQSANRIAHVYPAGPEGLGVRWIELPASVQPDSIDQVLADLIEDERVKPSQIAILVESEAEREELLGSSRSWGRPMHDAEGPANAGVVCDTVRRYKGLERPVVVLVEPEKLIGDPELLYVALTRARSLLVLVGSRGRLAQLAILLDRHKRASASHRKATPS